MANSGAAELGITVAGKDEVSAMLRQLEGNLKRTKSTMDDVGISATQAGAGVNSIGSQVDSLKGKVGGVNKLREGFEFLRANATFVAGAMVGVVGGFVALVSSLDDGIKAIETWEKQSRELDKSLQSTRKVLEDIDRLLGKPAPSPYEDAAAKAFAEWERLQGEVNVVRAALSAMERENADIIKRMGASSGLNLQLTKDIARAQDDLTMLLREQEGIHTANNRLLREQAELMSRLPGIGSALLRGGIQGTAISPAPRRIGGGGGGGGRTRGPNYSTSDSDATGRGQGDLLGGVSGLVINFQALADAQEAAAARFAQVVDFAIMADGIRGVTSEIDRMVSALDRAANVAFPDLAAGMAEVQGISESYAATVARLAEQVQAGSIPAIEAETQAAEAKTQALIAGSTAVLASVAKSIGGLKAEYAVRAAGEGAAAIASFATGDVAGGALHLVSAGLYASAAGGAGGSSASSTGGSGGGSARGAVQASSGPTTIVNNFSSLVTDRQQVSRALADVDARGRRSGYAQRRGA